MIKSKQAEELGTLSHHTLEEQHGETIVLVCYPPSILHFQVLFYKRSCKRLAESLWKGV